MISVKKVAEMTNILAKTLKKVFSNEKNGFKKVASIVHVGFHDNAD